MQAAARDAGGCSTSYSSPGNYANAQAMQSHCPGRGRRRFSACHFFTTGSPGPCSLTRGPEHYRASPEPM
eukprot:1158958-Pelagomonas_calceolata.AAC.5